jgi:hypothetical protein
MGYITSEARELAATSLVSLHDMIRVSCCTRITTYCTYYITYSIMRGKKFLYSIYPAKREA